MRTKTLMKEDTTAASDSEENSRMMVFAAGVVGGSLRRIHSNVPFTVINFFNLSSHQIFQSC